VDYQPVKFFTVILDGLRRRGNREGAEPGHVCFTAQVINDFAGLLA
jgi:hypothetical protein